MFTHVSVWLDNEAHDETLFQQALAWASRLRLPLEGCSVRCGEAAHAYDEAFARASASRQVAWNRVERNGDLFEGMRTFLRPHGLSVCSDAEFQRWGRKIPHGILDALQSSMMFAPPAQHDLDRLLVLDYEDEFRADYVDGVARLCTRLGIEPVVLTVADDETMALRRQKAMAAVMAKHRLRAEFDLVLEVELVDAVRLVAACRGCSHVVVENTPPRLRNCWWRSDPVDTVLKRVGDLGVVVYPRPPEESARIGLRPQWSKSQAGVTQASNEVCGDA